MKSNKIWSYHRHHEVRAAQPWLQALAYSTKDSAQFNLIPKSPLPLPGSCSSSCSCSSASSTPARCQFHLLISHYLLRHEKQQTQNFAFAGLQKKYIHIDFPALCPSQTLSSTILQQNFIINGCRLSAHWIQLRANTCRGKEKKNK